MVSLRWAVGRDIRAHVQALIRVGGEQDRAAFLQRFVTGYRGLRPFLRHIAAEGVSIIQKT